MAILGVIRKQTWLLIVVIGVAMLAFLAGDLFSENSVLKRAFTGDPNEVGSVNGESITIGEFINLQNQISGQGMSSNQVSQQVWNALVFEKLIEERAANSGLFVTDEEVWNYMAQRFGITADELKTQVAEIKAGGRQTADAYNNFINNFESTKPEILYQKYLDLVMMGIATTNEEAKLQQIGNIQNADIEYGLATYEELKKRFKVEVTDEEINAYVKKHAKMFDREGSVNLSYVYFPSQPSQEDEAAALTEINKYLTGTIIHDEVNNITDTIGSFASAQNDSIYVSNFSERPFMSQYLTKKDIEAATQLPEDFKNFLLTAQVGQVGGPFKTGNAYQLLKISKTKPISDSINSSHILISYAGSEGAQRNPNITRTRQQAQVLADSILTMAKANPSNFKNLVDTYSDDLGSKTQNGNIGWTPRTSQNIAPEYLQFLVNNPKGEIGITESRFGYHIIRIDDIKSVTGYQIANIFKEIRPSQETSDKNFSDARNFAQEVIGKSNNEFANLAHQKNYNYNSANGLTRYSVTPVLDPSSEIGTEKDDDILRWAFSRNTKIGDSSLFTTSNQDHIIVYLTARSPKGLPPASMVRDEVEPILVHQKLTQTINEALGQNPSIDAFVKDFGAEKSTARINFGTAQLLGKGFEPKVAGAAFGLKVGGVSKAIEGNAGVYVIKVNNVDPVPTVEDASFLIDQMNNTQLQKLNQQLMNALVDAAEIKDFRSERLDR